MQPALAADFSGGSDGLGQGFALSGGPDASDDTLKGGFSDDDWANSDKNDPLSFPELGHLRYWYSWGAQHFNLGTPDYRTMTDSDSTQSVEAHFRVDDASIG